MSGIKVIKRECGGWLALSGPPLRIGVTADTEAEARELLWETTNRWLRDLGRSGLYTFADWETGQDVEVALAGS